MAILWHEMDEDLTNVPDWAKPSWARQPAKDSDNAMFDRVLNG
jgi:hypothetical protein